MYEEKSKGSFEKYLSTLNVNQLRYLKKLFELNQIKVKHKKNERKKGKSLWMRRAIYLIHLT